MTIDSPLRISPLTTSGAPNEGVGEKKEKGEEKDEIEDEVEEAETREVGFGVAEAAYS